MISTKDFYNIYGEKAIVYRQKSDDLKIFGCVTKGGYPIFGVNFIRGDSQNCVYFWMDKPEIFTNFDGEYNPTYEDLKELNDLLDTDEVWNDIIIANKEAIHNDYDDLKEYMIDFSKIPSIHPDYTKVNKGD